MFLKCHLVHADLSEYNVLYHEKVRGGDRSLCLNSREAQHHHTPLTTQEKFVSKQPIAEYKSEISPLSSRLFSGSLYPIPFGLCRGYMSNEYSCFGCMHTPYTIS